MTETSKRKRTVRMVRELRLLGYHVEPPPPNRATQPEEVDFRVCSFIRASMAGSRSTAPLSRSNSVLIVAPPSAFEIYGHAAPLHEKRKGYVLNNTPGVVLESTWHT